MLLTMQFKIIMIARQEEKNRISLNRNGKKKDKENWKKRKDKETYMKANNVNGKKYKKDPLILLMKNMWFA